MKLPQSYVEMLNSGLNRPVEEGARSFPTAAMEIMLLNHAQHKAHSKEVAVFRRFSTRFNWQLSHQQQSQYVQQLKSGDTLILTDAAKVILWTSQNLLRMTGYRTREAVGQKPSMFQGPDTDLFTLQRMQEQLSRAEAIQIDLVNYRKDGTPYQCRVSIDPIHNVLGELTHFLAVEHEHE